MTHRLCFCPATSGGYGIVHVGADIPGSQILMASSNACGRHISISSYLGGYKDRISFYVMDEIEIIMGVVEDGLIEAATKIISDRNPDILLVYVCCSTYIAGLDDNRLRQRIKDANPGTEVLVLDMNPVAVDTFNPPAVSTQRRILGLLDYSGDKDGSVNLIGSDISPDPECELYELLRRNGVSKAKHLTLCKTYQEFLDMGKAGLNIVLSSKALGAAKDAVDRIPYLYIPPTYSISEVEMNYRLILGSKGADTDEYASKTRDRISECLESMEGLKISVGSTATERPFALARSLAEYGFDIASVFHSGISKSARADLDWLKENVKGIGIYDVSDPALMKSKGLLGHADVAIGFNAAYFTGATHVVNMILDMGLFGFHGISRLMDMIMESLGNESDLVTMVEDANLVI